MEGIGGAWKLQLSGDFALRDPSGALVRLFDRKVEGLLAILAMNREYGVERQDLADMLWPGRTPSNLANLRQALSTLRRAIGAGALDTNRALCRLSSDFPLVVEPSRGAFMPGHDGEWFEDIRLGESEPVDETATAVAHFFEALKWFAQNDRRGLHALLTARISMTRGLGYSDLLSLLYKTREDPSCLGWSAFWRGTAEDDLEACASHLREALSEAKRTDDLRLASEVCYELGKVYSRSGKLAKAMRICDIADEVANSSKLRSAYAGALRLRGTVLAHWQDQGIGLQNLRDAEKLIEDPLDLASAMTTRAFYEASAREHDRAADTLKESLALSQNLGHHQISVVSQFTDKLLRLPDRSREESIADLGSMAQSYYSSGTTQLGVYSEELLARLIYLDGDIARAKTHFASAQRARNSTQMILTKLEEQRIRDIA